MRNLLQYSPANMCRGW
ncbi:TPA: IncL/M-type plasmid replication leader peptide RepB [Citrobacter freundii]|uniref:RepB n=5 Tax=Enterobacterales TaxID=91347 RepID=A0A9P1QXN6_CITFR|nr:RepB [Erwinia amylovora]AEV46262.1 RepB [Klebsiella pneumoniae]AKB10645.1 repB [Proteus mirabilis]QOU02093.1 replication protein RepB [Serratia marcescens]UQW94602.1 RepB [Klebsiella pneumoniae subsp. pneumoniae]CRN13027.1 RepB [Citrobacter freundii]CRN13103.1 RepB [Raoultella planticola]SMB39941.1 RepB [Escherichia coli]